MKSAIVLLSMLSVALCSVQDLWCSTVTPDQLKCMKGEGTIQKDALESHCKGVDFDILEKGEVRQSKLCEHPMCTDALEKLVYIPCHRSDLGGCLRIICANLTCGPATDAQMKCFDDAGAKNGKDLEQYCSKVDFDLLKKGMVAESKLCEYPACIASIEKDIYAPCNRSDFGPCLRNFCAPSPAHCSPVTEEQVKCMNDTAEKHSLDLDKHCKGVDLSILKELKIKESKLCEHPECIDAIEKDVYVPCDRSDLGGCLRDICATNVSCDPVTPDQLTCMKKEGTKNGADVVEHCKGVDMDALANQDIKGSKICEHDECISALTKDIYAPCHRSDLGGCIRAYCKSELVNCTAVTPAEEKCMTDAGTKNGEDVLKQCQGVDFDALKKGDLKGSKLCDHPACIEALDKDVYTPCKRHDLTNCVKAGCKI